MRKGISIIIEVCITYFNPHFRISEMPTISMGLQNRLSISQKTSGASASLFYCCIHVGRGKLLIGSPPLQEVRYHPSPHWPWRALVSGGFLFSWHRACISKTTGWGGHRVHPVGCTMAPIGFCQRCVDGGFFCSTILHSMVRCSAGRVCLWWTTLPILLPSLALGAGLVSGGFSFSWHRVCTCESVR